MKRIKLMAAVLSAAMVFQLTGFTAFGVTSEKITSVSLVIEADIELEGDIGDQEVDITTKSQKYSVEEYEFENDGFSWSEEDVPRLKVVLAAEDGYRFSVTEDKITLKGATLVDYRSEDFSKTLNIYMTLPPLEERVAAIESVDWDSLTGVSWSKSMGAGSYEVRLFRDGKGVGATRTVTENSCDFSDAMTKSGTYYCRVRPVNWLISENKGEWVESPSKYIDDSMAAQIRENPVSRGEWKINETGWWYSNSDGTYPANQWLEINGKWYFFNEQGYMVTGWVDWNGYRYYCDAVNGDMLVNTVTPDGHTVDGNGALIQ